MRKENIVTNFASKLSQFAMGIRLKATAVIALLSTIVVAFFFPHQIGVLIFKANVLTCAAICAYLLDRGLFPYARPSEEYPHPMWMYRRVALIVGVMLAAAVAL
jgi:hypothetical protein